MKHFSWDYEESKTGYYHVYSCSPDGESFCDGTLFTLDAPKNKNNDKIIDTIVDKLDEFIINNIKKESPDDKL